MVDTANLNYAFALFKGMQRENLSYIYRGIFTQTITDNIISLAETSMDKAGESAKIKKRVFTILVEGLQNVTRHQDSTLTDEDNYSGIFAIQQKADRYYITTGNIVEKGIIDHLTQQLDKINGLEEEELKQYYKDVLNYNIMSNKGGAGLGLIEMARKSGNKLAYGFKEVNEQLSFFYLHTEISFEKALPNESNQKFTVDNIKELHQLLIEQNVLLIFNGFFNQENLINLLSIIENQMIGKVGVRKRVFNIMVEMLQNIVKHGDNSSINSGNPGIFFINKIAGEYCLNAGNYISSEKIEPLKERIEYINSLSMDDLNDFYNKSLFNFQIDSSKEAGLGLIELRLKSNKKLIYTVDKIDDQLSFFTLQAGVN